MYVSRLEWIESLGKLREECLMQTIPDEILQKAMAHNAWFTPFYIQKSIAAILDWWEEKTLTAFLQKYPEQPLVRKKIGIIAAGNVPCVGLQDILMVLWSGNVAYVKLSHQDDILIPFLMERWKKYLPVLENLLFFVPKIEEVDFLIATGSNNTARYIEYNFDYIPKIIRKNRFSVAILRGNETAEDLQALCEDIFLYNGLGCRNVSHIFALTPNLLPLQQAIYQYDIAKISATYLQKINYERAKYQIMPDIAVVDCGTIFLKTVSKPQYAPIGVLHICFFASEEEMYTSLADYQAQIQCVVGKDLQLGQAQKPKIDDFADGVDVWERILQ